MFCLQITNAAGQLVNHVRLTENAITLGRDPRCTISLPQSDVSREHAVIESYGNFFVVKDLASTNGTWVNGSPVKSHILRAGDVLKVGENRIVVEEMLQSEERVGESCRAEISDEGFDLEEFEESGKTLRLDRAVVLAELGSGNTCQDRLVRINQICRQISYIDIPEVLYHKVLEQVLLEMEADRIGFLVVDEHGHLRPVAALSVASEDPEDIFPIHSGVLDTVSREQSALLIADATVPAREDGSDSVSSVMCAPLVSEGRLCGALYMDRLRNAVAFTRMELELLVVVAGHISVSLTNSRLFEEVLVEKRSVQSIIDSLQEGLVITGPGLVIENVNVAASRMLPMKGGLVGKKFLDVLEEVSLEFRAETFVDACDSHGVFKVTIPVKESARTYVGSVAPYPRPGENGPGTVFVLRDSSGYLNLENLKSYFIQTAAHKLRTPLTVLIGNMELIRVEIEDVKSPGMDELLDTVSQNLARLWSLVERFVEFTELDQRPHFSKQIDLNEVIDLAWAGLIEKAADRGVRCVKDIPVAPNVRLQGDRDRLVQCFSNLLDNAIKFSATGEEVRVEAELSDDGGLDVRVVDAGLGIPVDQLPYVFSGFHQVEARSTGEMPGAGLGLTIAQRILHVHGASIHAESPNPMTGKGSVFRIRFPAEPVHVPNSRVETSPVPDLAWEPDLA